MATTNFVAEGTGADRRVVPYGVGPSRDPFSKGGEGTMNQITTLAKAETRSAGSGAACRFCGSKLEHTFVDLGASPLVQSFLSAEQLNQMSRFTRFARTSAGNVFLCSSRSSLRRKTSSVTTCTLLLTQIVGWHMPNVIPIRWCSSFRSTPTASLLKSPATTGTSFSISSRRRYLGWALNRPPMWLRWRLRMAYLH